jgi:hypothetical protein
MRRFGFCATSAKAFSAVVLSGAALTVLPVLAHAHTVTRDAGNTIAYSGSVLMRIRTDAGGIAAEQRADEIVERLRPILELPGLRGSDIKVQRDSTGMAMIFVRDLPLVTVDADMARANNTNTPALLAEEWASRLRSILPQVSVSERL